jgi:uncharacterized protein (TIGR00369 family)
VTKDEILRFEPPSSKLLGREVVELDTGKGCSVVRYAARPEFLNRHGSVQGGLLGAMLDSATALALYAVLPLEQTAVTTNLDVAFLKPAKPGAFTAVCKVVRRDQRSGEVSGELRDADGVLVAKAIARLKIVKRKADSG